jgi:ppGpp synthetase/RelA/SpoT-type nucleotidyltranferase
MSLQKPLDLSSYVHWMREVKQIDISHRDENHYNSATSKMQLDFGASSRWSRIKSELLELKDQYLIATGFQLFLGDPIPTFVIKPYSSFLLKTFRRNILDNDQWPGPPNGGWITPDNWYTRINDILRTLIVVKYLDGVEFVAEHLRTICSTPVNPCRVDYEAKEEGYYAAHAYVPYEFEIPRMTWDTQLIKCLVEIQISTQLQELIRRLLHKYYEESRKDPRQVKVGTKWQWQYRTSEFAANYLGHILHYVEGMIMEVRDRQKETK